MLDFGRCPCGGVYEERSVEIRMTAADGPRVFEAVPQGACPVCGSRVYKALLLDVIEHVMHDCVLSRDGARAAS
jgi:hypothetical protein